MNKTKTVAKKTMEESLADGSFIAISAFDTRKAGIIAKVVIPKEDCDLIEGKPAKHIKSLLNAVAWMIHRCQANKIPASTVVALEAKDMPPLAMACVPMSLKDNTPVILVARRKEEKCAPKTK